MAGTRFTTWLSEDESTALKAVAETSATSQNLIVRFALRSVLLDKPIPNWLRLAAQEVKDENASLGAR